MGVETVYLSLGSNLGDRVSYLQQALAALSESVLIEAESSIYETEPQDCATQPAFLNMAAAISTDLEPLFLLTTLQGIEQKLGRVRDSNRPKGPRT